MHGATEVKVNLLLDLELFLREAFDSHEHAVRTKRYSEAE